MDPLVIVVGGGGVGKTTLAAAIGLASAHSGDDTLVMTFDPSLRLKDTLGVGDEAITDYWTATKREATGTNPKLTGPEYNGWRRQWELSERRKLGAAGLRRRQKRRWPDLG